MSSPKVLVSGVGSIGKRHLNNLHALGVSALAYADPYVPEDGSQKLQRETGAQAFSDFGDALASFRPDIVFICTPTRLHVPQAIEAARSGAHLFIEKPLSHTFDRVGELERIVESRDLIAAVACNMRFHPGIAKIREIIGSGAIGTPIAVRYHSASYLPRWHPHGDYAKSYSADPVQGGAILDCIHEIDLALWQFGPAKLVASAVIPAEPLDLQVDGIAEIILRHESGVLTSMHLSFMERQNRRSSLVVGTHGTVNWDDGRGIVELIHEDGSLEIVLETERHFEKRNDMFLMELKAFLKEVKEGKAASLSSIAEGKAALEIALAARSRICPPSRVFA